MRGVTEIIHTRHLAQDLAQSNGESVMLNRSDYTINSEKTVLIHLYV